MNEKIPKENMYLSEKIMQKRIMTVVFWGIDFFLFFFFFACFIVCFLDFNKNVFLLSIVAAILFGTILYYRTLKLISIAQAAYYAKVFYESDKPFIDLKDLPEPMAMIIKIDNAKGDKYKIIERAIENGYLVNCTIEIHDGVSKVALAKEIVIDTCPYCGAPIVGVTTDIYECKYCKNKIYDVIKKK